MADELDLQKGDELEEGEENEAEPDFGSTRTMAPAHDHDPIDEELEEDLESTTGHPSISLLGTEENEEAAEEEIAKNYFLNGYDDEAPYSEFDEHGEPIDN